MRLRKPEIGVVNVDSVASASKHAQAIKFNYNTAVIKSNQTILIIIINIAICPLHIISRHHGMTLQFHVRNDVNNACALFSHRSLLWFHFRLNTELSTPQHEKTRHLTIKHGRTLSHQKNSIKGF